MSQVKSKQRIADHGEVFNELMAMENWTYAKPGLAQQGPDPAYYQGGHFNLDISTSALQTVLGAAFGAFQKDVLGRSDPDPGPTEGRYTAQTHVGRGWTVFISIPRMPQAISSASSRTSVETCSGATLGTRALIPLITSHENPV